MKKLAVLLLAISALFGANANKVHHKNYKKHSGCYVQKGTPCPGTVGMVTLCPDNPNAPMAKLYDCNAKLPFVNQ